MTGSKCKCTLADGSGEIDLTPLFAAGALSVRGTEKDAAYTFTYDACKEVYCNNKCEQSGGCLGCQSDGKEGWWGIASVTSASFGEVTTSGWTFTMSYSNKQQSKASQVSYTLAASGGTQYTFTSEDPPNTYNLAIKGCFNAPGTTCGTTPTPTTKPTSAGGPSTTDISGWPGLLLISLLIIAVALYFAIGMPIMYYVKGARGLEMIPLISFWKDFPFLVKDGVMFTLFAWPCCINIRPQAYSKI